MNLLIKLGKIFWPIEYRELKKFLPMAFILFCILFNYTLLRGLKDSLIIPSVGAEAISFLKLWFVLPSAILFIILYSKLLNSFDTEKIFAYIIGSFIAFFALFGFYLLPNADLIHPNPANIANIAANYPNFKWFIFIYGKWCYALFYISAEIWGSAAVSLLFWQFANKITQSDQAKRFYPLFGLIANAAVYLSGEILEKLSTKLTVNVAAKTNINEGYLLLVQQIIIFIIIAGVVCIFLHKWMCKSILTDPRFFTQPTKAKKKVKLSITESFKLIISSKYLGYIALLVLCYGVSMNLVEGIWKSKIRELYPTGQEYLKFMGTTLKLTGIGSMICFIAGSNIIRIFSWLSAAMITPVMMMITGLAFFLISIFDKNLDYFVITYVGTSSLALAVTIGLIQNVLTKATKYALFDSTKEMAYIPIDEELKTRGKSAVDVIGGRLGKSGGALVQFLIFTVFHTATYNDILLYLMIIFAVISIIWIYAVIGLNKEYQKLLDK